MSVSLSKVLGGSPSGSVPVGYWTSVEVMNALLPDHWGERAYGSYGRLFSHEVMGGNSMADYEHSAHLRECCEILWKALCDGVFEALVRMCDKEPERIPPDSWMSVPRRDIRINFILGEAYAGPEHESPLKPIEGGTFLFETEKVRQWLADLPSPHLLPKPLKRDPWSLSPEPSVTQCEAISWLADGVAKTAFQLQWESAEASNFCDERLSENRVGELGEWHPIRVEFEYFVASELARTVRINSIRNALRDLLASRELEAFGCFVDEHGRDHKLSMVDPDFFLHPVSLSNLHDLISTDANAEGDAWREAREAGQWKSVRFRRRDLIGLFGENITKEVQTAKASGTASTTAKRGPKLKWDWVSAKIEFDRLMAENGPLSDTDPDWNRQAQIEVAISEWFETRLRGEAPSESRIRYYVGPWLKAYLEGL